MLCARRFNETFTILCTCLLLVALGASLNPFAPEKHTPKAASMPPARMLPRPNSPERPRPRHARTARISTKPLTRTSGCRNRCSATLVGHCSKMRSWVVYDGSRSGIFDIFRTFEFDFELIRRSPEIGNEFPRPLKAIPTPQMRTGKSSAAGSRCYYSTKTATVIASTRS